MIPSSATLRSLRAKRQITIGEVAQFVKVTEEVVAGWEGGDDQPIGKGQLSRLAGLLNVPEYALFDDTYEDDLPQVYDYRSASERTAKLDEEAGRLISYLRDVQDYVKFLSADDSVRAAIGTKRLPSLVDISAEQGAQAFSANLGFHQSHLKRLPYVFTAYEYLRRQIEKSNIIVLQSSVKDPALKGACLYDPEKIAPVVWVNTYEQNHNSRMFSLLHEVGHVLSGDSGISSTYEIDNNKEAFCNKFAANVLLPRREFSDAVARLGAGTDSNEVVNRLAKLFVSSKHAIVIRLVELGFAPRSFVANWLKQFEGVARPDTVSPIAIPAERDQGRTKLAQFGFRLAQFIEAGLKAQLTSPVEIFETIRLKPKYLEDWLRAARERTSYLAEFEND